ncbi:MAG: cysteine hydrolase family protein [Candidatus Binatia bacterium]
MAAERPWRAGLQRLPSFGPEFSIVPERTALLIIDMQYLDAHRSYGLGKVLLAKYPDVGRYYIHRLEQLVVPNQLALLGFFREHALRIVHITVGAHLPDNSDWVPLRREADERVERETGTRPAVYPMGSFEHSILAELQPGPGELVINKVSRSAFTSTGIDQVLRNMNLDTLIVTGVATNSCVEMTSRDAADRGYKCVIVDDACATLTPDMHDAVLRTFAMLYGKVQDTQDVIEELRRALQRRPAAGRGQGASAARTLS